MSTNQLDTPPLPPRSVQPDRTVVYVVAVGGILALAFAAIVALTLFSPAGRDNNPTILIIVGMATPVVVGVVALLKTGDAVDKVERLSINVDGRLSQLLTQTGRAAHAEGVIAGAGSGGAPDPVAVAAAAALVLHAARVTAANLAASAAPMEVVVVNPAPVPVTVEADAKPPTPGAGE
jgi:hypothetical protein